MKKLMAVLVLLGLVAGTAIVASTADATAQSHSYFDKVTRDGI